MGWAGVYKNIVIVLVMCCSIHVVSEWSPLELSTID